MWAITILSLERSLSNLRVRASYIEVYSIFDSLGLELEVEAYMLKERNYFIVNSLSELFYGLIYLRGI